MFWPDHAFFYALGPGAHNGEHAIFDLCFDLAYTFKQDPDVFLSKPFDDLWFMDRGVGRMKHRLKPDR